MILMIYFSIIVNARFVINLLENEDSSSKVMIDDMV